MYRESPTAVRPKQAEDGRSFFSMAINGVFLMTYFTLLPVFLSIIIHWAVYTLMMNTFYQEPWMAPSLLLLATFLSGALMRQKMEDDRGGMTLFVMGIAALVLFAWLTYEDILHAGATYSAFMPKLLSYTLLDYVWMLPAVGILGMLAYKYFTLKHYG